MEYFAYPAISFAVTMCNMKLPHSKKVCNHILELYITLLQTNLSLTDAYYAESSYNYFSV